MAVTDAMTNISMARKVEELLSGLYTFYQKSYANRGNMKKGFEEIVMKNLMPTRMNMVGVTCLPRL